MSAPPAKRQKLDSIIDLFDSPAAVDPSNILTIRDLSFQTPLRKKLNLIFTGTNVEAHSPAKQELSIPLNQARHVICVAAPDKAAKTWNFVIIFGENENFDAWVFGVPDTIAKTAVGGDRFVLDATESYKSVLVNAFKQLLGIRVVEPSEAEFSSPIPLPGRPKDTAFHIIAHRGAKEGFLYFLESGILYGFRKPVLFFPLSTVREVTFTNILQRTFNLVVSTEDNVEGEEFGMIDQAVFAGIQGYTAKHQIQDASLSEQRKAKKVGKANQEPDETGELEKAVKEYEDMHGDDAEDFRDFDKAEEEWENEETSTKKPNMKARGQGTGKNESVVNKAPMADGEDPGTSDDEELDATFEAGDSDGGSLSGSSEESSEDEEDSEEGSEDDEDEDMEEESESSGDREDSDDDENV